MIAGIRFIALTVMLVLIGTPAFPADWEVVNDEAEPFRVKVISSGDASEPPVVVPPGEKHRFQLGADPHVVETEPIGGEPQIRTDKMRLIGRGRDKMSKIRTPVGNGPNGMVYREMGDFVHSPEYDRLLGELQHSRWVGRGWLILEGDHGTGNGGRHRNDTVLSEIRYIPGPTYLVFGKWKHEGRTGEIYLRVDPEKSDRLEGFWRYTDQRDKRWVSGGTARRR